MERRIGKTTRLIDEAVQELFNNGVVWIPTSKEAELLLGEDGKRGINDLVWSNKIKFIDPDHKSGNKVQDNFRERFKKRLYSEHIGCFMDNGYGTKFVIKI